MKTDVISSPAERLYISDQSGPAVPHSPDTPVNQRPQSGAHVYYKSSTQHPMNSKLANQLANILSFNSTPETVSQQNLSTVNTSKSKSHKKDKKSILQRMLVKEKETLQHSSTLASFLSSLN